MIDTLARDVRYAVLTLRKNPGFTAIAVLSLGLGIGATTTIYSVIESVDFRQLPYRDANRLVALRETRPPTDLVCAQCPQATSLATTDEWQRQARSYDALGFYVSGSFGWLHGDTTEWLSRSRISWRFFSVLGTLPQLGRDFAPEDMLPGAEPVVIVSDDFWRKRLHADPQIIGTRLTVFESDPDLARPMTVVGVMQKDFRFGFPSAVWTPIVRTAGDDKRDSRDVTLIGRLNASATLASANAELSTIARRLAAAYRETNRGWGAIVEPLRALIIPNWVGAGRFALMGIVTFVLLIAVANVAGLFLARTTARQHELMVRSALGASRARVLRQLLVEGVCVGVAGGVVGVMLASWGIAVAGTWFQMREAGLKVDFDFAVCAFAVGVSLLAGAATGLLPALHASRADLHGALRERANISSRERCTLTPSVLTAGLVAAALVLLTGAGLLTKEFIRVAYRAPGFDPKGLNVWVATPPRGVRNDPEQLRQFAAQLQKRITAIPGVRSASMELVLGAYGTDRVHAEGRSELNFTAGYPLLASAVDPGFFRDLGINWVSGRAFTAGDGVSAPRVAIVNEAAASALWPGQPPLGRRVRLDDSGSSGDWCTVVGIVGNAHLVNLDIGGAPSPSIYRPIGQPALRAGESVETYVRLQGRREPVMSAVGAAIRAATNRPSALPFSEDDFIARYALPRRLSALALNLFAGFAVLLAAMGVYGVVAYAVGQRTREIGTRIALGAQRVDVLALIARRGIALALGGVVAGVIGSLALSTVLRSLVYGTSDIDPLILGASALLMVVIALLATYIPARRATAVDPMTALRAE